MSDMQVYEYEVYVRSMRICWALLYSGICSVDSSFQCQRGILINQVDCFIIALLARRSGNSLLITHKKQAFTHSKLDAHLMAMQTFNRWGCMGGSNNVDW